MSTITLNTKTINISSELMEKLSACATETKQSLENFVNDLLTDALNHIPNKQTIEAIDEAQKGKYAGILDMKDFDSFVKSIDGIK